MVSGVEWVRVSELHASTPLVRLMSYEGCEVQKRAEGS